MASRARPRGAKNHRGSRPGHAASGAPAAELSIERLVPGGAGLARLPSGRVVFVDAVVPGDRVSVDPTRLATGRAGRPLAVLTAGPLRVSPACSVAEACGGCDWMHVDAAAQATLHAELVREQLAHALGGVALPEIVVHRAPRSLAYRTRARLHLDAHRGAPRLGFRAARSRDLVVPDACAVLEPELWEAARRFGAWLDRARGGGELSVGWGRAHGQRAPVFDLRFDGDLPAALFARVDEAVASGEIAGARVWLEGAAKPSSFGDPRPVQRGADGLDVVLAAGGFGQPSDEGARLLAERAAALAATEGQRVLELFAGSGTLSITLAPGAALLSTTELDRDAVSCARENLARRGLEARVSEGDAETRPLGKVDVVVLDPPRTGAPGATAAIVAARPRRVVYVSCDPATLARDAAALAAGGYSLTALEVVELFPQTSHVETIARFERLRPGRA